ncbi:DUF4350 domain-containing protein [Plantactinospora sp. CA-290183]|uniref:DUF4350 domain-containing protein n=1 Tax=Plantactinospora sp. CA-290183 TaxID=3240006 RepID=UPI003D8BE6BA
MTTPTAPRAAPARRRRWHRIALPVAVAALLLTVTWITHAVDQPDPDESGFLSPVHDGDDGGSRLAAELRARGVAVQRVTSSGEALRAAGDRGGLTLFVPAPGLVHPWYLPLLAEPADSGRLVLVDPPRRVLGTAGLPFTTADRRWAARAVGTDADGRPCPLPEVRQAGVAAALRQRYTAPAAGRATADRCYEGGLTRTRWRGAELVAVGASDPFRNDRIDEQNNAALAVGLLATRTRVVWLDLRGPEPPPPAYPESPPDTEPGSGLPDSGEPADAGPEDGSADGPGPAAPGGPDDRRASPPDPPNPLWGAFPPWFWALLVQLALALLLVVLWRARRLGPPVPEPLPVTVRSAETTLGRARLYRRARARGPAAGILRAAALHRILPPLNRGVQTPGTEVAAALAARTGRDAAQVHDLLYGPAPTSDRDLLDLARALDGLTRALGGDRPEPPRHGPPPHGPPVHEPSPPEPSRHEHPHHDRSPEGESR